MLSHYFGAILSPRAHLSDSQALNVILHIHLDSENASVIMCRPRV